MNRSFYSTSVLLILLVGGFAIAIAGQSRFEPVKAAQKRSLLKDWEFPGAEQHRLSIVPGTVSAADYTSPKTFEDVWTYYAKKIGYNGKYEPNGQIAGGTEEAKGAEILILNSTGDPRVARSSRPKVTAATLIRRGSGANVTVFLSRGKDEDKTHITLVVEGK